MEKEEPRWCDPLRKELLDMAQHMATKVTGWKKRELVVTPEQFGYQKGLATTFLQKAIDYASNQGGGIVRLKKGDYLSGTIVLKSNVCLEIEKKARLLGSTNLQDYPEHIASRRTVMDTNMGMNQSLIFAEGCFNIAICGTGIIDGQGSRKNFPGDETTSATPGRPFLIRILDCVGVHIKNVTIKNPACWTQNYLNCEQVLLERIKVESQSNYNNDGIDLDGCRDVIVRKCYVSSGDDALCLKGASKRETDRVLIENCTLLSSCNGLKIGTDTQGDFRNILVRNCVIGGVSEAMHRIKHPHADSGISWEAVDGGIVERIWATNIQIVRAFTPFFIRLDKRGRRKPEDEKPPISQIRQILMENICGAYNGPRGSYFLGIPERSIQDIVLKNVKLDQITSQRPVIQAKDVPVMYGFYPDAHMIDHIGDAPAYGLWVRDAERITLMNYQVIPDAYEKRPMYVGIEN